LLVMDQGSKCDFDGLRFKVDFLVEKEPMREKTGDNWRLEEGLEDK